MLLDSTICNVYNVSLWPHWFAAVSFAAVSFAAVAFRPVRLDAVPWECVPCLSLAKAIAKSSLFSVATEHKRQVVA